MDYKNTPNKQVGGQKLSENITKEINMQKFKKVNRLVSQTIQRLMIRQSDSYTVAWFVSL